MTVASVPATPILASAGPGRTLEATTAGDRGISHGRQVLGAVAGPSRESHRQHKRVMVD
jgi:hypothetical protein